MWQDRFKRTHVINLPERGDRRAAVAAELERLGMRFEFFQGVRGRDNPHAHWFFHEVLRQGAAPSPGMIGCHLSHALIWIQTLLDAAIAANDFVLVMEDDLRWAPQVTNELIAALLARVPADAMMIKFSVADWHPRHIDLEQHGQVRRLDDGVYLQRGMLGGLLMYAVRKSALPQMIQFNYPGNFDNALLKGTFVLLPFAQGIWNPISRNFHFGVCYQGGSVSDITP